MMSCTTSRLWEFALRRTSCRTFIHCNIMFEHQLQCDSVTTYFFGKIAIPLFPASKIRDLFLCQIKPRDEEHGQGAYRAKHHLFRPHCNCELDISVLPVKKCDVSVKIGLKICTLYMQHFTYLIGFALEAHESKDSSVLGSDVG